MRRFSAVIQDNEIKALNLEEGGGMTCSLAESTLDQLKALA
jgi:peroxiredoxin